MTPENQKEIASTVERDIYKPIKNRRKNPGYPKAHPIEIGIHAAFIKAELIRHGYTQKRVAKELNLSTPTIYQVINGTGKSRRVAEFIAKKIGLTLEQMWPGKYVDDTEDATDPD